MDTSLVFLDADFSSRDDLFHTMGSWLKDNGYVN